MKVIENIGQYKNEESAEQAMTKTQEQTDEQKSSLLPNIARFIIVHNEKKIKLG